MEILFSKIRTIKVCVFLKIWVMIRVVKVSNFFSKNQSTVMCCPTMRIIAVLGVFYSSECLIGLALLIDIHTL